MVESSFLFPEVRLFDGDRSESYQADVLVEDNHITRVVAPGSLSTNGSTIIETAGATLMPGMVEAHAHLSFGATVDRLEGVYGLTNEEKLLRLIRAGRVLLDSGFTSAYSAGNRVARHDVLARSEFEGGWFPGPRFRAAFRELSPEMLTGQGEQSFSVDDICRSINQAADLGADIVKMELSGESGHTPYTSRDIIYTDEQVAAAGVAAQQRGIWLSAHAHAPKSIKQAVDNGFRMLYHCTWADEESLDLIEAAKEDLFVCPAPGYNLSKLGTSRWTEGSEQEETVKLVKLVMPELKRRGVRVLPGGDYGFVINPIGNNARDLGLFVDWFGFTTSEVLTAATKWGGQLMDLPVGLVKEGYLADLLLVDGDPLENVTIMEDSANLHMIMKDGRLHKVIPGRIGAKTQMNV